MNASGPKAFEMINSSSSHSQGNGSLQPIEVAALEFIERNLNRNRNIKENQQEETHPQQNSNNPKSSSLYAHYRDRQAKNGPEMNGEEEVKVAEREVPLKASVCMSEKNEPLPAPLTENINSKPAVVDCLSSSPPSSSSSSSGSSNKKETSFVKLNEKLFTRSVQTEVESSPSLTMTANSSLNSSQISYSPFVSQPKIYVPSNLAKSQPKKYDYQDQNENFNEKDKVRVVVRIRPINDYERVGGDNEIISCDRTSLIVEGKTQSRKFFFDTVFDPNSTQDEMFNYCGIKRLVNMAIDGYICTCFAYGQTGSGKTYTMVGPSGTYSLSGQDRHTHFGLIPRAINYLFNQLRQRTQESQSVFYIRVSYYEIYNEHIRDLINPNSGRKLEVRGSQEEGFFVDNLFATYIETMDEILTILQEGELNRATAAHLLNEHSSRSHAILTIQVENELQNSQDPKEQITKLGKLIFVDLAGSEKVKVTQSKGKNLTETNNINKSLLVLGTCISALSDPNKRTGHIPYRDSKLTKLLSESLGGTGITLMIACVSPSISCENETLNTLRYANRAQNIENVPLMKSDSRENIVLKLKRELRKLKEENHSLKVQLGYINAPNNSGRLPKIVQTNRNGSSNSNTSSDSDLYGMLQEYIQENKTLKNENSQLEKFREKIRKQHEVLTRENEKLARKLEQFMRTQGGAPGGAEYMRANAAAAQQYMLMDDAASNNSSIEKIKIAKTGANAGRVTSNSKALPVIDKRTNNSKYSPGEPTSVRSTSPVIANRTNSKKHLTTTNSTMSDPGDPNVEQIEIVRPSYTRKYKQLKDFKTTTKVASASSDPNLKKTYKYGADSIEDKRKH